MLSSCVPSCVPSWVIPGTVAENAAFLQRKTRGIMLCAFEHAPRLPMALPLTPFDLTWHVHLPVDLPWTEGGAIAGEAACNIMEQARHLCASGTLAVLHPPPGPDLLHDFLRIWKARNWSADALLLENLPESRLDALITLARDAGLGLCLDVAHLALSGNMTHAVAKRIARHPVRMIHWSAPRGGKDAHAPLTEYSERERRWCRDLALGLPRAVDVLEVFDWQGVQASWDVLCAWRKP